MLSHRFMWYIVAICIIVLFCSYLGCNDNPSVNEADRTKLNEEYEEALELVRQIESEISDSNQGDIPESYFQPPPPPAGGIESVLEGVTEESIGSARILEYMLKYYPLALLEDDVVSQLDDQQRAEYKRQNDALDKDLFGPGYTLIKRVESLLRVPIAVLNILSKE
ncbi:hypothetical protein F4X33_08705 [Candidatus Poribacteria bacterium]|nr:hypothetical protein [Candidatus Poribacteria bacterium]